MKNTLKSKTFYRMDSDIQQNGKYYPQLEYTNCAHYQNVKSLVNLSPDNLILDTCSTFELKYGCKRTDMLTFGSRYPIFSTELKTAFDSYQLTNTIWIPVKVNFPNGEELLHVFYPKKLTFEDDVLDFERTTFKIVDIELDVVKRDILLNASNPFESMNERRKEMGKFETLKIDKIFLKEKQYDIPVIELFPFETLNSILISTELKNKLEELKLTGIQFLEQIVYLTNE